MSFFFFQFWPLSKTSFCRRLSQDAAEAEATRLRLASEVDRQSVASEMELGIIGTLRRLPEPSDEFAGLLAEMEAVCKSVRPSCASAFALF